MFDRILKTPLEYQIIGFHLVLIFLFLDQMLEYTTMILTEYHYYAQKNVGDQSSKK